MAGVLQGKLLAVTIDGEFVNCQVDATLTITTETETTDPCKPDATQTTQGASWTEATESSKSWSISMSAKAFADAIVLNNSDILDKLVNGSATAQVQFSTTETTDYDYAELLLFSGTGIITNFTWNAPSTGESTYDVEITGSGQPTFTRTPFTT